MQFKTRQKSTVVLEIRTLVTSTLQGMNEDVREYKGVSLNAFYNPSTSYIGMLT